MTDKLRYDVVITGIADNKVSSIVGRDLPISGSFHTVAKRLDTARGRINEHYWALAVPPGRFNVGDILPHDVVENAYEPSDKEFGS